MEFISFEIRDSYKRASAIAHTLSSKFRCVTSVRRFKDRWSVLVPKKMLDIINQSDKEELEEYYELHRDEIEKELAKERNELGYPYVFGWPPSPKDE